MGTYSAVRLVLGFASVSANEYIRMYYHVRHAHLAIWESAIAAAHLEAGSPMALWPALLRKKYRKHAPCDAKRCISRPEHRDRRGNGWCGEHFEGRPEAKKRLVVITRYSAGRMDRINFAGGCKPVVDALVRVGLLYDDTEEWLDDRYVQDKAAPGGQWTEIVVSEI